MPQVVGDCFFVASRTGHLEPLLRPFLRVCGEAGLGTLEAGVMLTTEMDGVLGSSSAEGTLEGAHNGLKVYYA